MTDAPGHYFDPTPGDPTGLREVALPDGTRLLTAAGTFSATRLDTGTRVLLGAVTPDPAARTVVDVGCGYGPIAVTLATALPEGTVWAVDVNPRAVELTRRNAARLGLPGVRAVAPEEVPAELVVDELWSNPPIRVGKDELHRLLDTWLPRLAPAGVARLVVARNLGADSLQRWLEGEGWSVRRISSRKGYRVLEVRHSPVVPGAELDDEERG